MSGRASARGRGRTGRGDGGGAPPRRPGETARATQQPAAAAQQAPPAMRPQPPSAWGPPAVAQPVRASVPAAAAGGAGRASHRTPATTHEHPGDVDVIQERIKSMAVGKLSFITQYEFSKQI